MQVDVKPSHKIQYLYGQPEDSPSGASKHGGDHNHLDAFRREEDFLMEPQNCYSIPSLAEETISRKDKKPIDIYLECC